jgi:hypothetical protein
MLLFGHSLLCARILTALLSASCAVLLYLVARRSGLNERAAFLGSTIATLSPLPAIVGSCTVPEWPTAVFCAGALLLVRRPARANLILSAALLFAACLSRYDVWPVSIVLAASVWFIARRQGQYGLALTQRLLFSVSYLLGPILWIAWNAFEHGDPFHFQTRVSSYRSALGYSLGSSCAFVGTYPSALLRADPMLWIVSAFALACAWSRRKELRAWAISALGLLGMVAGLVLAEARGGAPTHHPERALLTVLVVGWLITADLLCTKLDTNPARRRAPNFAAAIAFLAVGLRSVQLAPGYGADRRDDERIGSWLSKTTDRSDTITVFPLDYGYFAMKAAFGFPERLIVVRSLDPRDKNKSISDIDDLARVVKTAHSMWVVMPSEMPTPALEMQEQIRIGRFTVFRVSAL